MPRPNDTSSRTRATLSAALFASAMALLSSWSAAADSADPCTNAEPPPGAQSLGYVRKVFCVAPTTASVAVNDTVSSPLYSGKWYDKNPYPMALYAASGQGLVLSNGGYVMTESRKSLPGALPLLLASEGFYVEFAERISGNDPDFFPAVWMMPQEHNALHSDHRAGDPPGSERWMELDVDEGGFNTGHHGALINWSGVYPAYQRVISANDPSSTLGMDRTQEHIFGLSYDPSGKKVTWWVDGAAVGSVSSEAVPAVINGDHYYLIMSNQTHGQNHPYKMTVRYFSAWSKNVVPNPPSGVKVETTP